MLTAAQLGAPAPGTFGSISDTFRHLLEADSFYLSVIGNDAKPGPLAPELSLAALRLMFAENATAWAGLLSGELDPEADITEYDNGREFHFPLGVRLAQALHHGTDHRSQICTALTSFGVVPPDIDVWAFAEAHGLERVVAPPAP